jgi:V8-like Glu-specific endopeptidase
VERQALFFRNVQQDKSASENSWRRPRTPIRFVFAKNLTLSFYLRPVTILETQMRIGILIVGALLLGVASTHSHAQSVVAASKNQRVDPAALDYANAKPMSGRTIQTRPTMADQTELQALAGTTPGYSSGSQATVTDHSKWQAARVAPDRANTAGPVPSDFGTSLHPFTTVRVTAARDPNHPQPLDFYYPFRAAGKLFFDVDGSTYVCSAALVKKGVIITAAHCVSEYGAGRFYANWVFVPAFYNGQAPFGVYTAKGVAAPSGYVSGTDNCNVVCPNDVAVIVLEKNASGVLPGEITGTYGFGYDGWGFTSGGLTQITQLGYPVALDNGVYMERNDSQGYTSSILSNNTVIGTLETGGSSGGPWINNLGVRPVLNGTAFGAYANPNIIVGVTSWGYSSNPAIKEAGASRFTKANAWTLVNYACTTYPGYC